MTQPSRTLTGRAARRAQGDTRKRKPYDPTSVRGQLDLAARRRSSDARPITAPPIKMTPERRKAIKKFAGKANKEINDN